MVLPFPLDIHHFLCDINGFLYGCQTYQNAAIMRYGHLNKYLNGAPQDVNHFPISRISSLLLLKTYHSKHLSIFHTEGSEYLIDELHTEAIGSYAYHITCWRLGSNILNSSTSAFASNFETSGIYSSSLIDDEEIYKAITDATGEAKFVSKTQAASFWDSTAAASSGNDISYSINIQSVKDIPAAHTYMGKSDESVPVVASFFKTQKPTGKTKGDLRSGTLCDWYLEVYW